MNDFYRQAAGFGDHLRAREQRTKTGLIESRSALYDLWRKVEGMLMASRYRAWRDGAPFAPETWVDAPLQQDHAALMAESLGQYEARLHELCDRVAAWDAQVIFVTQSARRVYDIVDGKVKGEPAMAEFRGNPINGVDYYYMIRLLNARTMQAGRERGAICIDLDRELEFDLEHDMYDRCHATPSGARKIGLRLYRHLQERIE